MPRVILNAVTVPFIACLMLLLVQLGGCAKPSPAVSRAWGADVSMLVEIERAGGSFEEDPIRRLVRGGWTTFRLRLFVDPSNDYDATHGATQDMEHVVELAKRVQDAGGDWMLDLHYSDRWADPEHQRKPAAWESLSFDQLEQRVHDYTADVLDTLASKGLRPRGVQVGNEITAGMLFPDGRIKGKDPATWARLARLFNAGAKAVRARSTPERPIEVMLHVHGGGREGIVTWFVDHFSRAGGDFDSIGVSFYPVWGDDIDLLKTNLHKLATTYRKPIWILETSYPWRSGKGLPSKPQMRWPLTPEGQVAFVEAIDQVMRGVPDDLGAGVVWWYPEAIPHKNRFVWRGGSEAMFDSTGRALPSVDTPGRLRD